MCTWAHQPPSNCCIPSRATPGEIEQFLQEAQIIAALMPPHIGRVFDFAYLARPRVLPALGRKIPGRERAGSRQAMKALLPCDHRLLLTTDPGLAWVRGSVS